MHIVLFFEPNENKNNAHQNITVGTFNIDVFAGQTNINVHNSADCIGMCPIFSLSSLKRLFS
jgi:hypothetical protein